ncbi:hypothetical protein VXE65_22710 [Mycolicibacterium conceptionense]|uniref:hypothetical protein n=1 Tax=Mycolicibacterium conceptionense TaxID=451644 RepID=UPI0032049AE1
MTAHPHDPDTIDDHRFADGSGAAEHFAELAQGRADRARLCADRAASAANGAESLRKVAQSHVEMACAYARAAESAYTAVCAATAPRPRPETATRAMVHGIGMGFGLAILMYLLVAILVRDLAPAPPVQLLPPSVQHSVPASDRIDLTHSGSEKRHGNLTDAMVTAAATT